jgi:uncharacterized membrane protein
MNDDLELNAKVIYLMQIVSILIPFLWFISVVLAYVYRNKAEGWLASHYRFQIGTFWIGMLFMALAAFFYFTMGGLMIAAFVVVWILIRCIKGVRILIKREAYPSPTSWMV